MDYLTTATLSACRSLPQVSPLLISDRLISLAEQAGQVGCTDTARHLIRLASAVLEEKTGFAPPPFRA